MRRTIKRYGIALALFAVLIAVVGPRIEQARRKLHPPRNYSEAIIRDQPLLTLKGHTRRVNRAAFSVDGARNEVVKCIAFSPDGKRIASASMDHSAKLWDAETGREIVTFTGHLEKVWSVAFSPDGKQVASSGSDETVRVWDADNAREFLILRRQAVPAFSLDGKRLLSSGMDQTVNIWNLAD